MLTGQLRRDKIGVGDAVVVGDGRKGIWIWMDC